MRFGRRRQGQQVPHRVPPLPPKNVGGPPPKCAVCASVGDPSRTSQFEWNDDCTLVRTVTTTAWRTA